MKVTVKGVTIDLTPAQIAYIEKTIIKRDKELKTFENVLKHFGFRKLNTKGWVNPDQNCYTQNTHGWFVEILDYGKWKSCLVHGTGLDHGHPFGKHYDSPESLCEAIVKALG